MRLTLQYQGYFFVPDDASYAELKAEEMVSGQTVIVDVQEWHQRTDQQRKAIEVYCAALARAFNDAGLDARAVLAKMRDGVEIPWSQERVKDLIWREIQLAILKKKSTTKLSPVEVSKVYEVVNRFTAQRFGLSMAFPSRWGDGVSDAQQK